MDVELTEQENEQADEWLTLCSQSFIEPGTKDFRDVIQSMIASEVPRKIREFVINTVEEAHSNRAD
jgi:hypothetical protein